MAGNSRHRKTTRNAQASAKKKTTSKNTQTPKRTATKKQTASAANRREPEFEDTSFLQSEAVILGAFAVCVLLFLSNFHICGMLGDFFSQIMLGVFGCIGYLAPLLLFAEMLFYASNRGNIRAVYKMIAVEVLLIVLCGFAQLIFGGGYQEGQTLLDIYQSSGASGLGGGLIGGTIVLILHAAVGTIGAYVILLVLLIISLVCITERSFVSAVKRGSGKAYQYAKEDYGRRKEIREERQAEQRRLREEQRVQGVDLAATDFSKNADFGGIAGSYAVKMEQEKKKEAPSKEQKQTVPTYVPKQEKQQPEPKAEPKAAAASKPAVEQETSSYDPADVFKGKITMGGRPFVETKSRAEKEENTVPFEEDRTPVRVIRDEDIFISHDGSDFDDMNLLAERTQAEKKPKVSVLSNIPDLPLDTSEEEDDEILAAMRRSAERKQAAAEQKNSFLQKQEAAAGTEETISAAVSAAKERPVSEMTDDELLDTKPYEESDDYWIDAAYEETEEPVLEDDYKTELEPEEESVSAPVQEMQEDLMPEETAVPAKETVPEKEETEEVPETAAEMQKEPEQEPEPLPAAVQNPERQAASQPDDRRRIVTASGKVIETDTEEIIRQKAEKRKAEAAERAEREEAGKEVLSEIKKTEEKPKKPYVIPPLDLLKKGVPVTGQSEQEFKETAIKLQQTLRNFGVGVTVTNISCGPTVTRYELHPEQGVKVSRILSLSDDIKLNLAAADIRIEAPIPGKAAVGIEVPNKVNSMVYLRDLLESAEFKNHKSTLAFAVGKDIGGQVIVADLAKMPHLLIAGQTGSGKSVGINTMIMSLIYRSSPDDVKLIMIDPKVVELSVYNGIPHLLIPVVTDPKKAAGALNWAVAEMMDRYKKFAASNVRDLKGYNAKVADLAGSGDIPADQIPKKLPQLVIIIDELADLMMVASNEVEDAICRLAQLARAAGIHLVIATQRPSVNVITGVIKANVPSRIAFSVASGVDSRTILDMNGAEKLLGNGDMLFYPSGYPKPLRVQGAFVSDGEVSNVTEFLKEQNADAGYNTEIEQKLNQAALSGSSGGQSDRDALFTDAGKFIIEKDKASIGMLQRMFKIGFNRAARIMDQLAEAGVVGEEEGTKPRKILMSKEEFEEFLEAGY